MGTLRHWRALRGKNRYRSWIRRVFHNHRIARPHKRFADQIESLLASIGDQQIFIFGHDPVDAASRAAPFKGG